MDEPVRLNKRQRREVAKAEAAERERLDAIATAREVVERADMAEQGIAKAYTPTEAELAEAEREDAELLGNSTVDAEQSTQQENIMESTSTVQLAPVSTDATAQQPGESLQAYAERLGAMVAEARRKATAEKLESGRLGENIHSAIAGTKLTLTIDLSKVLRKSASGKSNIVATTGGNVDLGNGLKLGVNCYRT